MGIKSEKRLEKASKTHIITKITNNLAKMQRITTAQYRKIATKRKISKEDQKRIDAGLEPIESEDVAQMRVIAYLDQLKHETGKILKYTAIPNSTRTPYKSVRTKNLRLGLRKGLCDMLIVYRIPDMSKSVAPRILFLEMKREKGGNLENHQSEWIEALDACEGVTARCAEGYEEAKQIIDTLIY